VVTLIAARRTFAAQLVKHEPAGLRIAAPDAVQPLAAAVVPDASRRVSTPTSGMPEGARSDGSASTSFSVIHFGRTSLVGACREWPSLKPADSRRAGKRVRERARLPGVRTTRQAAGTTAVAGA